MTQTKDDRGCDFPQGIIALIITLEKQEWQQRGGPFGILQVLEHVCSLHIAQHSQQQQRGGRQGCAPAPFQFPPTSLHAESVK